MLQFFMNVYVTIFLYNNRYKASTCMELYFIEVWISYESFTTPLFVCGTERVSQDLIWGQRWLLEIRLASVQSLAPRKFHSSQHQIVSSEAEGPYHYSTMFHWEPEGCNPLYKVYEDSALLVPNGILLNGVNAILVLNQLHVNNPQSVCSWLAYMCNSLFPFTGGPNLLTGSWNVELWFFFFHMAYLNAWLTSFVGYTLTLCSLLGWTTRGRHHSPVSVCLTVWPLHRDFSLLFCEKWSGFFYLHRVWLSYSRDRQLSA